MAELLTVANVKCQSCVNNIISGLLARDEVMEVEVEPTTGTVIISGDDLDRADLARCLGALGYPEVAE